MTSAAWISSSDSWLIPEPPASTHGQRLHGFLSTTCYTLPPPPPALAKRANRRNQSPVVGYELSPRKHKDWQGMFGHTCTMFDMAVMDEIGAGWSMRRLARLFGVECHEPDPRRPNWPDTELLLNFLIRRHGIKPHLIGHEENHVRNRDENIDHCRSLTAALLYNETRYRQVRVWAEEAMAEARERIEQWRLT